MKFKRNITIFLGLLTIGIIAGCASSAISTTNILIEHDANKPAANVYFIRPLTYRDRGVADKAVRIELNNKVLMLLSKGEYALIRIKPVNGILTTRNVSMFTNKQLPIEMAKSVEVSFEAGQTYFIHIKQVNEEFRGVYYLPELVDLSEAKKLVDGLKKAGLASSAPIDKL
jgi:hypothetical protein